MPDTIRHDDHDARHDADTNGDRRVSIREAAEILDVTSDAIRARLRRGTLRKETGPKGETVVVLDTDTTHPVGDTIQHDADTTQASADYVAAVEKQVEILRAELTERNRELSEMRRLLAGALDRIPALPPSEAGTPRDGSVTASETPTSAQAPQDDAGEPRAERSWWQRIFGT